MLDTALQGARNVRRSPAPHAFPGSTWNRTKRRCSGWMGSAVRVITRDLMYGGIVRWSANQYVKEPDSGRR